MKKFSWYQKLFVFSVLSVLLLGMTGCNNDSEKTTSKASEPPIKIEELELHTETVNEETVFWFKNNSGYTITGVHYKKVIKDTDEIIGAYSWQGGEIAPGETSDTGSFTKDSYDENGEYLGQISATTAEVTDSYDQSLEINYIDENGEYLSMAYDFTTKSYKKY